MSQFLPVAGGATQVKQRLSAAAQEKNYQQNRNRNPQQPQKNVTGSGFFFCLIHHLHFFALLFSTFRISPRQCACAAEKNSKRKALTTVSNSFTHAGYGAKRTRSNSRQGNSLICREQGRKRASEQCFNRVQATGVLSAVTSAANSRKK